MKTRTSVGVGMAIGACACAAAFIMAGSGFQPPAPTPDVMKERYEKALRDNEGAREKNEFDKLYEKVVADRAKGAT